MVSAAIDAEINWSAANLQSMITALTSHESDASSAFTAIDPGNSPDKLQVADGLLHHAFGARPPFNPGTLVFTPATIGPELADTADQLLSKFVATHDAAVGDAIAYWSGYATRMSDLATTLADAAAKLLSDNDGAAFDAAAASLAGLAGRITNVAASAGILTTHLGALPAVKAMAINTLGSIAAQSRTITDPAAKQVFERAEIAAFMAGPYLGQLQTSVPTLTNLTQPDFTVSAADVVASGISGGHGIAGATQAGLSPAGMTTAAAASTASAPASAASAMNPAGSGPITNPAGMSPTGGTPSGAPVAPSASGPINTIPGGTSAPMAPSGATSPAATSTGGGLGAGPTGMAPAAGGAGSGAAGGAGRANAGLGALGGLGTGAGTGASPGGRAIAGQGLGHSTSRGPARTGLGAPATTTATGSAKTPQSTAAMVGRHGGHGASGAGAASSSKNGAVHRHGPRHGANVGTIHGTGRDFEQDEYQRELFGDEPTTVPAVIGANVRG